MADITGPREEVRQAIETLAPGWDADDLDGFVDSLCELIDARIAWERDQPRTSGRPFSSSGRPEHVAGSARWYASRMVPTQNAAEAIEEARQTLMQLPKRQLVDLIQQLAAEAWR